MKLSCDIIRDLLPLYAEELASAATGEVVRRHLEGCEDCRKAYEEMKRSPVIIPAEPGLDTVRRGLWRRRLLTALCAVLAMCMLGCGVLSWLTAPIYLDESVLTEVLDNGDGTVTVSMDAAAVGRQTFQFELEPSPAGETFVIWTSRWLEWNWSEPIPRPFSITRSVIHNGIYLFTGREEVQIYENPVKYIGGGEMPPARMELGVWFQAALVVGALAMGLAFLLRKRRAGKWLGALGTLAFSYGICQGVVCGFTFASFFVKQEFLWAAAMGTCLWGTVMCLWAMRKKA